MQWRRINREFGRQGLVSVVAIIACLLPSTSLAAPSSDLTQVISTGTLSIDILDASRNPVSSPTASLGAKNFSFDCQFGGNASAGALGSNSQRLYAVNPAAATPNGWNVTLAATGGATATWSNTGATKKFDYNDPTGTNPGCSDGVDADSVAGQLSVNPAAATLTTDCSTCTTTGITKGSQAAFSQGATDSVTLLTASAGADNPWRGYLTGLGLNQTIPAEQPADSTYSLNMTITIAAL
jgi:hypothetical protein